MNEFCYWLRAKLDILLMRFDPWGGDDSEVENDNFTSRGSEE